MTLRLRDGFEHRFGLQGLTFRRKEWQQKIYSSIQHIILVYSYIFQFTIFIVIKNP